MPFEAVCKKLGGVRWTQSGLHEAQGCPQCPNSCVGSPMVFTGSEAMCMKLNVIFVCRKLDAVCKELDAIFV